MLKDCLNTLLHELPEEPLPFIQQYFNAKGPAEEEPEAADAGGVAGGDEALMRAELNSAGGLGLGAVGYDSSDVSETDTSEEEDEMCAPPPAVAQLRSTSRASLTARPGARTAATNRNSDCCKRPEAVHMP